jgi:2-iminobutanoate/2-iminopropanoate deaminase
VSVSGRKYPEKLMARQAVQTNQAPAAIGPYSQAIRAGALLFISGQIPLDPTSGQVVGGNAAAQTHRVMESLGAILQAAGAGYEQVVRTTIFLVDLADFAAVNEAYGSYFDDPAPTRATVQVAALPKGVRVEIDAIAHLGPAQE